MQLQLVRPPPDRQPVNREEERPLERRREEALAEIEGAAGVHVGDAEVHVAEVVVEGLAERVAV